jgi:hypothetical protein
LVVMVPVAVGEVPVSGVGDFGDGGAGGWSRQAHRSLGVDCQFGLRLRQLFRDARRSSAATRTGDDMTR